MELDITDFWHHMHPAALRSVIGSIAEHGQMAASITWENAITAGAHLAAHNTPETLEAIRAHILSFGAWNEEETAGWPAGELLALLAQCIAGDAREAGLSSTSGAGEWGDYEANENLAHRLYRGANGRVYYLIGD